MKKIAFFFSFTVLFISSRAQTDNKIVIGNIDSIQSKILGEQRKLWVYVPNGSTGISSKQRYPVVYLLDGDAHFFSVVGMIQQLSSVNGNTICPEMIVVGIPNTDRMRDLTPTHVTAEPPFLDSISAKTTGGGGKFISFIEKELMPYIDSLYPTQPYRMLIGHSLGGLIAMDILVHNTHLFNAYVVIDPSMWWDNQKLLKETKNAFADKKYSNTSLFLGIANNLPEGMDTIKVKKDTAIETKHIRSILELSNYLYSNPQTQLSYKCNYYSNDDHGSVPLIAEYDAFHFFFSFYQFKLSYTDFIDTSIALPLKIENHFQKLSKKMGYKIMPTENMINDLGYASLSSKFYSKALYFFKLNVINYPESYNVYDSIADYYDAIGDKASAIKNYQAALTIKENPDTRKKLEKLLN